MAKLHNKPPIDKISFIKFCETGKPNFTRNLKGFIIICTESNWKYKLFPESNIFKKIFFVIFQFLLLKNILGSSIESNICN